MCVVVVLCVWCVCVCCVVFVVWWWLCLLVCVCLVGVFFRGCCRVLCFFFSVRVFVCVSFGLFLFFDDVGRTAVYIGEYVGSVRGV